MTTITAIREAISKRALYLRTVRELESLPHDLAVEDLGIVPSEARTIAHASVYGA